jgi:hypothetical protein
MTPNTWNNQLNHKGETFTMSYSVGFNATILLNKIIRFENKHKQLKLILKSVDFEYLPVEYPYILVRLR